MGTDAGLAMEMPAPFFVFIAAKQNIRHQVLQLSVEKAVKSYLCRTGIG